MRRPSLEYCGWFSRWPVVRCAARDPHDFGKTRRAHGRSRIGRTYSTVRRQGRAGTASTWPDLKRIGLLKPIEGGNISRHLCGHVRRAHQRRQALEGFPGSDEGRTLHSRAILLTAQLWVGSSPYSHHDAMFGGHRKWFECPDWVRTPAACVRHQQLAMSGSAATSNMNPNMRPYPGGTAPGLQYPGRSAHARNSRDSAFTPKARQHALEKKIMRPSIRRCRAAACDGCRHDARCVSSIVA